LFSEAEKIVQSIPKGKYHSWAGFFSYSRYIIGRLAGIELSLHFNKFLKNNSASPTWLKF
jgi:hypothetical protein